MITQTFGYNRRWTLDLYFYFSNFIYIQDIALKRTRARGALVWPVIQGDRNIIRQVHWIWLNLRHAYWTDVYIGGGGGGGQGGGHVLKHMWFTCTWWHLNGKRRLSLLCKKIYSKSQIFWIDSKWQQAW